MKQKRQISRHEEAVYRLVSHEFECLNQADAAKRLGISQSCVSRTLKNLEKKCPQLFPLLNHRQDLVYTQIVGFGQTHGAIAIMMNTTVRTIDRIAGQLRKKGVCFNSPIKCTPYKEYMDSEVKFTY